jgi:hypothetical protein
MAKKEKNIIETKWLEIKAKSKVENPNIEELDTLTCQLIADLAELTEAGITEIEGVSVDLMKDRVWWVVEKIGLLPEYKDEDDLLVDDLDIEDNFYQTDDEFDGEIDDSKFYR